MDALFSVMQKNVIKASSPQVGSGTTYLPKVFNIKVQAADAVPATPEIVDNNTTTFTEEWVEIPVTCSARNVQLFYSINGKKPAYKNGIVTNGQLLSGGKAVVGGAKQVTLNVIAVNRITGKASKVASKKYKFEPAPREVIISSADSVNQVAAGKNLALTATVVPSYAKFGTGNKVEWSVVSGNGVTVKNGKVAVAKGTSAGECVIQAKAGDKTANVTIKILDAVKITKVSFGTKKYTIYTNDTKPLNLAGENDSNITVEGGSKADVVWSSNNKNVATVDSNGNVTALKPGKATIKATANDGSKKAASCTITVKQLATKIRLSGPEKIAVGKSATVKATISPSNVSSKKLLWDVKPVGSASGTVTVSASGKVSVKAGASGKFEVTATEKDVPEDKTPQTDSIQFEVTTNPITNIKMPKTANLFTISGKYDAPSSMDMRKEMVVTGGDVESVEYTSSAPGVAYVTSEGMVYAQSSGKATITCTATDGSNKKAKCNVVVSVPMSRVTIVPKNGNEGIVSVGSKITLSAKVSNNFGKAANQKVKWDVVSGSDYITIDQKGVVTGKSVEGPGKISQAIVKAEAMDGSKTKAIYSVYILPKITMFELIQIDEDGMAFIPYITVDGGSGDAPSYNVDITGGKGVGYQPITVVVGERKHSAFQLVPGPTTEHKLSDYPIEGGKYIVPASDISKPKITVTLKDGSNKKVVRQCKEYVVTADGYMLTLKE